MIKEPIFICTAQHTGTWFLIGIVEEMCDLKVEIPVKSFVGDYDEERDGPKVFHFHVGSLDEDQVDHLDPKQVKHISPFLTKKIVTDHKTIIPLRNPILSLLTRYNRHPKFKHFSIVKGFQLISRLPQDNIFFFPIDICKNKLEKEKLLRELADFLEVEVDDELIKRVANDWQPVNSTDDRGHRKRTYQKRGPTTTTTRYFKYEYQRLVSDEHLLSFLEQQGYNLDDIVGQK